jgi:hypothetical protein
MHLNTTHAHAYNARTRMQATCIRGMRRRHAHGCMCKCTEHIHTTVQHMHTSAHIYLPYAHANLCKPHTPIILQVHVTRNADQRMHVEACSGIYSTCTPLRLCTACIRHAAHTQADLVRAHECMLRCAQYVHTPSQPTRRRCMHIHKACALYTRTRRRSACTRTHSRFRYTQHMHCASCAHGTCPDIRGYTLRMHLYACTGLSARAHANVK